MEEEERATDESAAGGDSPPPPPPEDEARPRMDVREVIPDAEEGKRLLWGLLDFSFKKPITPKIVSILYVVAIVLAALQALGLLIGCLSWRYGWLGLLGILAVPVIFVLAVVFARVSLELVVVLFRIAENTDRLAEKRRE